MVNMSAKFGRDIHNGSVSVVLTRLFLYMSIVTLTSKISRVNPLVIVNMSGTFDEDAQFKINFYRVHKVKA